MRDQSVAVPRIAVLTILLAGCASSAPSAANLDGPGRWSQLASSELPTMRHENGYVRVGSRFYLVGGRGDRNVEIFDPATATWQSGTAPPIELHHFQAVEYDGKVYIVGAMTGRYPTEPPVPAIQIYDPVTNAWSQGPEIPEDRRRGGAGVVVHEGIIYIVAGIQNGHTDGHVTWVDSFDPRSGSWRRLADAPHARDHFHAGVIDGKIYVAGGRRSSAATGQVFQLTVPQVDVYDIAVNRWTTLPESSNIPTQRAGATAAVLDGRLIIIGGESGTQETAHSEVEMFDPATARWTSLAPLIEGRHGTQAVVHDGRLYIAAGSRTRGATEINTHEVYTPGR